MTDQPTGPTRAEGDEPPGITISAEIADRFIYAWADQEIADELGTKLACFEVDALAELLEAFGAPTAADAWIHYHATGDDEDDSHYGFDKLGLIDGPATDEPATGGPALGDDDERESGDDTAPVAP